MKIRLPLIGFLFVLGVAYFGRANAQTNEPDSANALTNTFSLNFRDMTGQEQPYYTTSLLYRKLMVETLPANLDTNDNWGLATNGLQLSLRLRSKKYVAGDVIPAITIFRNLEFHSQTLLLTNSPSFFFTFLIHNEKNELLSERKRSAPARRTNYSPEPSPPSGLLTEKWDARSEMEIVLNLNNIFNLSQPGVYSVQAVCRVYSPTTKTPIFEVRSGTVTFQISKKSASP